MNLPCHALVFDLQAVRVGTYLWSFSVYCETEDETKKDRLPKDERVPVAGLETTQTGSLRGNEQLQLEPAHYLRSSYAPQYYQRPPIVDNESSSTQPKGFVHAISGGGGRVAPERRYDESNG